MSLILKGIDMPKEGEHIIALIKSDGECSYWKQEIKYGNCEPMQTVEAIQIPTPHGRLIDGGKLRAEFNRTESGYCGSWEFCDKPEDFQFLIDDEPTILEAEE